MVTDFELTAPKRTKQKANLLNEVGFFRVNQ
jgi:hypothetical protein